jgi:hypothetical protein
MGMVLKIFVIKPRNMEELGIYVRIILKRILNEWDGRARYNFTRIRIGISDRLLWT